MVAIISTLNRNEKEALLIMFGSYWRKKFSTLDGEQGRPSIAEAIDFALLKRNAKAKDDLVTYVEKYLQDMARRCAKNAKNG